MQNEFLVNSVRFISLVLIQVLLLNNINFLGYINPYIYILFILAFPLTANKGLLIFLSFILGLTMDMFSDSGGVHAAASVAIGYLRPALLKFSFGVSYEYNTIKISTASLGQQITYVAVMVLIHHLLLFSLEIFSTDHILLILKSTLFSGIFSVVLILAAIQLFSKRSR